MTIEHEHLGGYIPGGDEATFFPHLWTWLVEQYGIRSVVDLGCGEGHSLKFFRNLGVDVVGIEGTPQDDPDIVQHDFTTGPYLAAPVDLVWTCEFLEHVEAEYASNLVTTLRAGKIVLMTHAFPGQGGHHHVNCRTPEYWMGFMTAAGFVFDPTLTAATKIMAQKNTSPWNHYLRAGMAFTRFGARP